MARRRVEVRFLFWTNYYGDYNSIVMYRRKSTALHDRTYMTRHGHRKVGPIVRVEIPREPVVEKFRNG